jgi:SAM-dependent methyltransferase
MAFRSRIGSPWGRLGCGLLLLVLARSAVAQDYGDTPYVQTPQNVVDTMLKLARVGADDYVIDLGSGDGRMVITAAKRYGARGFGVDLDRRLVALGNANAASAGVADRAVFYERDLHDTDVSRATVLTLYLLPEVNLMIRPKLLATLQPGTRIVSHDYDMGRWPPDYATEIEAPGKTVGAVKTSKVFYWVVPAHVAGRWHWSVEGNGKSRVFVLDLEQDFQKLSGTLTMEGHRAALERAKLVGDRIEIAAVAGTGASQTRYEFSGRIVNHAIEGEGRIRHGGDTRRLPWKAARIELWDPRHYALRNMPPCQEMGVPCGAR